MICPNCKRLIRDGAVFCGNCGYKITEPQNKPGNVKKCPRCHTQLNMDSLFCIECGYKFKEDAGYDHEGTSVFAKVLAIICVLVLILLIITLLILIRHKDPERKKIINEKTTEKTVYIENTTTETRDDTSNKVPENTEASEKTTAIKENENLPKQSGTYIKIIEDDIHFSSVGEEKTVSYNTDITDTERIHWEVTDRSVAEVDSNGTVKAVSEGQTYLIVSCNDISDKCAIDCNFTDNDYIIADSSSRYLSLSDIEHLNQEELRYARNEIYARHGRLFNDKGLQTFFDSKAWYKGTIPPDDFKESDLNAYERDNVRMIEEYEKKMGYR